MALMHVTVDTSALESFMTAAQKVAVGVQDPLSAWVDYETHHEPVFGRYFDGWGEPQYRNAAAEAMVQTAEAVHAAGVGWRDLLDSVAARMSVLVPGALEVPVLVFIGMGTSNGWVTNLGGRATVFLAVELAAQPPLDRVLIAHELTHAAEHLLNPEWEASDYPLGAHAFAEGLGTFASQLAYPGHTDDEYLWLDSAHEQWLRSCEAAWPMAAAALLKVLDDPCGGAAEQHFFSARPAHASKTIPSRFGYYAGLRIVREAAADANVTDLLNLDIVSAQQLVRRQLEQFTN